MRHQHISFIKSAIREVGYLGILAAGAGAYSLEWIGTWLVWAGVWLIASEVIGIVEEIGHD